VNNGRTAHLEIRDPIHGAILLSAEEAQIVDSPYVQRLRGIKQTGFAELAFPGATHVRYSHSLGAFYLAGKIFNIIFKDFEWKDDEERKRFRSMLRIAALLHDVGHGPLSHAAEAAMPPKAEVLGSGEGQATHEDYTEAIILQSSLSKDLTRIFGEDFPLAVASIIRNENRKPDLFKAGPKGISLFPLLSTLISSEIDVDRMDYMVRDSLYMGIPYGHFDREWIFSNMTIVRENGHASLGLDSRAIYAFEDFLLSRYHMYLVAYLHHKSVIYDEMLYQYLKSSPDEARLPSSVDEYLKIDDYWLYQRMRASSNPWAKRIVEQKPYKLLLEIQKGASEEAKKYADELEQKLKSEKIEYFRASSTGLLSKYAAQNTSTNTIYVVYRDQRFKSHLRPDVEFEPLKEATDLYARYKKNHIIDRIYAEKKLEA
jgi:HD superfamily phosphohydrolase